MSMKTYVNEIKPVDISSDGKKHILEQARDYEINNFGKLIGEVM